MRRKKLLILVFCVPAIVSVLAVLSLFVYEIWLQATLLGNTENRYGGKIIGEIHLVDGEYLELLTIVDIQHQSAFSTAGIHENDVVLTDKSIGDFLIQLNVPSGTTIQFEVVDGGVGPSLGDRQKKLIELIAP